MKKRIILFTAMLLLLVAAFCSCGGNNSNEVDDGVEGVIYAPGTKVYISFQGDVNFDYVNAISDAVAAQTGVAPQLVAPNSEKYEHEITVGNTEKEISQTAYKRLDRYLLDDDEDPDDFSRYVIYSDGSSIAIAYDEDEYELSLNAAINCLVTNFLSSETLQVKSGVLYRDKFDIAAYVKQLDEEYRDRKWDELRQAAALKAAPFYGEERALELADELVQAFKDLYVLYTPNMATWFANLYEPYVCICEGDECQKTKWCGGGAYYYSNSGRNTVGYLPDAESTSQALGFISSSGMARLYGSSYVKVLTPEMREAIPYYIKNLQESNGFFYHPQWEMADTDAHLSRRARDLEWCTSMLSTFGYKPTYDTPSGVKGDGLYADGTPVGSVSPAASLASPLGVSAVSAVSKVIPASNTPSHLKDEESFRAYLATLDIHNSSYPVGNTLTAQGSQIKQTPGLMEILIEWLNANQNPVTGHWDWKVEGDPGYSDYYGVNGLLKISGIYNKAQAPLPYAEEAAQSAIDAITADESIGAVVDVYNTWFSISNIITNLTKYYDDLEEGKALADKIVASLIEQAPDAIRVSRDKIAAFQKLDGSFSYNRNKSSATSQGMPVAVPDSNEGDVNATVICSTGLIGNIYNALTLGSYKVNFFGESERRIYVKTLENLQPVIKDTYDETVTYATFDDEVIDSEPTGVDFKLGNTSLGSYVKIVDDPRTEKAERNVLEFQTMKGSGDYVYVDNNFSTSKAKCFVFEGDFCVLESNSDYVMQITMGSSYMFIFKVSGGKVNIWDASSTTGTKSQDTELGLAPKLGEWFNIKVEYYIGTHDTVRIKFYYNGALAAITDNYYNASGTKLTSGTGTPSKSFEKTSIYAMNGATLKMQMDNLTSYCTTSLYTVPTTNLPPINVDVPDSPEKIYNFSEGIPEDFTADTAEVVSKTADGQSIDMLAISGTVTIPVTLRTKGANCGITVMDVYCDESVASGKTVGSLIYKDIASSGSKILGWNLKVVTDGGKKYLTLVEAADGKAGAEIKGVRIPLGKVVELRIDYYHTEDIAIIYVDGEFISASAPMYKNATKYTFGKLEISLPSSAVSGLHIAEVKAERNIASFSEATKPDYDTVVYDFSGADSESVLTGNASVITVSGNKVASLDSSLGKAGILVPVLNRSKVMTVAVMELTLKVTSASSDGELYRLAFVDEDGNVEFALVIVKNGDELEIREGSAGGTRIVALEKFRINEELTLRVETYADKKCSNIYIGDTCVAVSSVFYNGKSGYAPIEYLEITSLDEKAVMTVDNVIAETLYKYYIKEPVKTDTDFGYGEDNTLDFENAKTNLLPGGVSMYLNSAGAAARIEKVLGYSGNWSSVLAFDTTSGANDAATFSTESPVGASSCVVFEADLQYTGASTGDLYQIMFCGETGGAKISYMLNLKFTNSTFWFADCSSTGDNGNRYEFAINPVEKIAKGEWFKFRVEYYSGTKETVRVKVYINDVHVYTGNNYYGHMKDGNDKAFNNTVNYVRFYTLGATEGTILYDNVKLYGTGDTCTDKVTSN